ncbi:MAG: S-layer protein domain-containing protein [Euryarchaeota archaeon]|nr:S-layer protein domain-containing protein [Euryarchaeota archaeon]
MGNRMNTLITLVVVAAIVLVAPASAETVEVRGEVVDAASQIAPFTWTARNFAGFYYDSDRNLMSEALTTEVAVPDTIDAGDLTYGAYRVKCNYTNPEIGEYFAIGWFGTKYMTVNGKPYVISPIILEMDKDDKKTLAVGQEWILGNGYTLIVRQIDLEGEKTWLELARDGVEMTSSVICCTRNGGEYGDEFCNRTTISGFPRAYTATVEDVGTTRTFVYQKDVGSENNVPVFSAYVDCIFRGTEANIVELKHAILIDDDPIRLIGAEVGRLNVEAVTSESVRLRNAQSLHLEMDSDIHVAEDFWFHVADDMDEDLIANYRYYPYIEHACSSGPVPPPPPPPPEDTIFEGELRINHGIEIEDDVRVEVSQVSTASRGSVTLCISSYQNDAVIVLSEGEPAVYRTISDEVIELEVVEVHSDSAWLVITGPADWEVTEYYVVGDYGQVAHIRGEVVELVDEPTADIVWNASNSALFWYDLNHDLMTEMLLLGPPCLSQYDRNIEAGCLHYVTSPVYKEYQVYENENLTVDNNTGYHLMGWMGDAYTAIGGNASKLCKLLKEFDGDDKKTLVVGGEEWNLDRGFALVADHIDLDGERAWLSVTKGGMEIDSEVVSGGEVYTYTADIGGALDVPIFTCYVDAIFRGTETDIVQVKQVFLIDDVVMEIEAGDRYGAMEVAIADVDGLALSNTKTSIDLDPGTRKHIMDNMYFETADDDTVVRFYPVAEHREPGVYEVRGTTKELTAAGLTPDADMVWDYNTFASLWYGPDDDLNTETLTIERSALNVETQDRELDYGTVTYRTHPVFREYDLKPGVGNESDNYGYFVEGWMGDAYAAIGGDAGKLCKLIVASGDEKMILMSGEACDMGRGFTLVADQINLNGTTANLTLTKYGRVIDSATVSGGSVYTYTGDIGGAEDVLIFSCYVDAVFRGTRTELVQVTHVFLINDVVREINLGDEYGAMEVVAASTDEIVLANTEPIDLDAGARELVMGDMYFVTADDETAIRFCPVLERIIGGDEPPADDYIFDCELEVNYGIEIEDDVTIELTRVSTASGGSAKLCLSSYQKYMTEVTLFMGDTPTIYETGSGENIYIEVTRVYNDSVRLRVTGPADWRITEYYVVSVEAYEVVPIHGEVAELADAQTADIVWDAYNFAAFHYDLNCDVTTETMRIASGTFSENGRTIDDESLTYTTEAFDVDFDCGNWGAYRAIDLLAESYFAGYDEDMTSNEITGENFDLISKNMLGRVLIDEDDARMLATGTSLQLEEGYEVKVIRIDVDGTRAQLELLRNGKTVDTEIINVPDTYVYVYESDLEELCDVPLIAVYIDNIFVGTGADMVKIDGIFQISEICISVRPGDSYGKMKILADDSSDTIRMHNYDPIDLPIGGDRGDPIDIGGRIGFAVADNVTLRFAPVATMVKPGVYEVRGAVRDVTLNQSAEIVWNASNSAFLWYEIDSDASTETLAIAPGTLHEHSRTIHESALSYTTKPVYQEYVVHENEGLTVGGQEGYMAEGWMGQKYVAIGGNACKLCKSLIEFGDYDKKMLAEGDAWDLGDGFTLVAREIDPAGSRLWFVLEKDGIELDSAVVSSGEVYVYIADVGDCEDEKDIPIFSCYVDTIFWGTESNMVEVKHVFMIDCDPLEIGSDDLFERMRVVTADSREIILRNDEIIDLGAGTTEHIMDEMYFRIADDDSSVRFYPFVERLV